MGHRLSKIYTRTGDDGTTGLGDGARIAKDSDRIEVLGTIDELNTVLGVALTETLPDNIRDLLLDIQHTLFDLGGELCMPGFKLVPEDAVSELERSLDQLNAELKPLKEFILPGGTRAAALCHQARSVCRRAERRLIRLSAAEDVSPVAGRYLNRLSDLLFVVARSINLKAGEGDVLWQRREK
jgi:cob(I)alamin adenosyltransferase